MCNRNISLLYCVRKEQKQKSYFIIYVTSHKKGSKHLVAPFLSRSNNNRRVNIARSDVGILFFNTHFYPGINLFPRLLQVLQKLD